MNDHIDDNYDAGLHVVLQEALTHYSPIHEAYICTYCSAVIKSVNDTLSHVKNHYQTNGPNSRNGIYRCGVCSLQFNSEDELSNHYGHTHFVHEPNDSDWENFREEYREEYEDSDDSDDENHNYICPVCQETYSSVTTLNTHFLRSHDNYGDLNILDRKKCDGFFGYELLHKINMCRFITNDKQSTNILDINNDTCIICCTEYTNYMTSKTDDDLFLHKMNHETLQPSPKNRYKVFNDDTKLLYVSSLNRTDRYPLKFMCCKGVICSECIKEHINSQCGKPCCPFCRKIHINTESKSRYVIYDERPKSKIMINPNPYPRMVYDIHDFYNTNTDTNTDTDTDTDTDSYDFYNDHVDRDQYGFPIGNGMAYATQRSYYGFTTHIHNNISDNTPDSLQPITSTDYIVTLPDIYELHKSQINNTNNEISYGTSESDNSSSDSDDINNEQQRIDTMINNYNELSDISLELEASEET